MPIERKPLMNNRGPTTETGRQSARISKIKTGGLDQCGFEHFEV